MHIYYTKRISFRHPVILHHSEPDGSSVDNTSMPANVWYATAV